MSSLSAASQNRLLVLGVGVAAALILKWAHQRLLAYEVEAREPKDTSRPRYITQATEDSLKPSTLEKLVSSPNWAVSEVAARIVVDRSLFGDEILDQVLRELEQPDHDRRERGVRALHLLSESTWAIKQLNKAKVYSAIVTALEFCVTDVAHDPYDPGFETFDFRDACERRCLSLVWRLSSEFTMSGFVKAGFVHRWLLKEPLGDTQEKRQENFAHLYRGGSMLSGIIHRTGYDSTGRQQLYKLGLVSTPTDLFDDFLDNNTRMTNGEDTAGEFIVILESDGRHGGYSPEEVNVRRRHREAVVLSDGPGPITENDIFQRDDSRSITSHQAANAED